MTLITLQLPTMPRITPIRHLAGSRGMGAMRPMGCPRPTAALDAESAEVPPHKTTTPIRRQAATTPIRPITPMQPPGAEVLGNIKALL